MLLSVNWFFINFNIFTLLHYKILIHTYLAISSPKSYPVKSTNYKQLLYRPSTILLNLSHYLSFKLCFFKLFFIVDIVGDISLVDENYVLSLPLGLFKIKFVLFLILLVCINDYLLLTFLNTGILYFISFYW